MLEASRLRPETVRRSSYPRGIELLASLGDSDRFRPDISGDLAVHPRKQLLARMNLESEKCATRRPMLFI
jgi:hypothetical protein